MFPVVLSRSKIKPSKYLANILWSESKFKNRNRAENNVNLKRQQ